MERYSTLEPRGMLSSHNYSFLCEPLTRNVNKPGRAASRLPFHFRNNHAYSPLYFTSDACQFSSVVPLRMRLLRTSLYIYTLDFKTMFILPEINRLVKLLVGRKRNVVRMFAQFHIFVGVVKRIASGDSFHLLNIITNALLCIF